MALHFAVILFGFTAIIGKVTDLNAIVLVWWRMLFSIAAVLLILYLSKKATWTVSSQKAIKLLLIGFLIALHWFCFYGAVKMSHVSVALICMSLTSLFTSILEPIITRTFFNFRDIIISLLIIPLMYWLIDGIEQFNVYGFLIGLLAALLAAVFSIFNRQMINEVSAMEMSLYEFCGVFAFSTPFVFYYFWKDGFITHAPADIKNLSLMLTLSLVCTNIAFLISVNVLKKLSAYEANLIVSLEPVYGIIFAFLFLNETAFLRPSFYFAAALIMLLTFIHPILTRSTK